MGCNESDELEHDWLADDMRVMPHTAGLISILASSKWTGRPMHTVHSVLDAYGQAVSVGVVIMQLNRNATQNHMRNMFNS